LWKTGLGICLGHSGRACPAYTDLINGNEDGMGADTSAEDINPLAANFKPPGSIHNGGKVVCVVHINGVHFLPVYPCACENAESEDLQYISMALWPATFTNVRTVFTFQLLDDYLLDNLECKTSGQAYFSKLRRVTSRAFPTYIPNRYRELLRAGRQWRDVKERKWFGFGHVGRAPSAGELAIFCAACPQPNVNIPANWKEDPNVWQYGRGFVMDGNFTCYHYTQKQTQDDVWLKDGQGYMTAREKYQRHLQDAVENTERSTCNEHHAVNDKSKFKKGCDSTGLGATACLRHGCYSPNSIVDYQKGERQMNMDYSLSQSLASTNCAESPHCIVVYDVMCQYNTRLKERMGRSFYLSIPEGLRIIPGIGLFHIHGHRQQCYARYSPAFIRPAGNADGEILETLWSVLNDVGRTTSTMTLAHRSEVLDAHMGDNNWKKLIGLVPSLTKKYKKALAEKEKFKEEFECFNDSILKKVIDQWTRIALECEEKRVDNVMAMDMYDVQLPDIRTRADVHADLLSKEPANNRGITSWIANGIKLEEEQ
jgi:hypothetical protein